MRRIGDEGQDCDAAEQPDHQVLRLTDHRVGALDYAWRGRHTTASSRPAPARTRLDALALTRFPFACGALDHPRAVNQRPHGGNRSAPAILEGPRAEPTTGLGLRRAPRAPAGGAPTEPLLQGVDHFVHP